jgi:hypothetical protein
VPTARRRIDRIKAKESVKEIQRASLILSFAGADRQHVDYQAIFIDSAIKI